MGRATFGVAGKITDDDAITGAEWKLTGGAFSPLTLAADGTFAITVEAPMLDSQTVTITVRARDSHSEATLDKPVLIDRVGPALRQLRPIPAAVITTPAVEIAVEATDGSGVITSLSIGGATVSNPQSGTEAVATLQLPTTLVGDTFSFEVVATDPPATAPHR